MDMRLLSALAATCLVAAASSCAHAAESRSIAGDWRVAVDQGRVGERQAWFTRDLPGTASIALPGLIDGNDSGPVWFQSSLMIPGSWKGKRVSLVLERASGQTRVWIDGHELPDTQESLVAPHIHPLGALGSPATRRLSIRMDRPELPGSPAGMAGLSGILEIRAVDAVAIDDVQVFPDLERRGARVRLRLANNTGRPVAGTLRLEVRSRKGMVLASDEGNVSIPDSAVVVRELKLGPEALPWEVASPTLYLLIASLTSSGEGRSYADERALRFGLRQVSGDATRFALNGRPLDLGGPADSPLSPHRGTPSVTPGDWRRILRLLKSRGMNSMRFKEWCPPEAAFAAADAEGLVFQVEAPRLNAEAEISRILEAYGNHPSFCLMTFSTARGANDAEVAARIERLRQEDPRRVYVLRPSAENISKTPAQVKDVPSSGPRSTRPE
jgi:beta-galactosidase/beta-glucuronidase